MSKQKMTVKRHIKNANDLAIVKHYLMKIISRCEKCFPKVSKLMKELNKINPNNKKSSFNKFVDELNEEYHEVVSNIFYDKHGELYDNLDMRFAKILKKEIKNE